MKTKIKRLKSKKRFANQLKKSIDSIGLKKCIISELLKISRPTLNKRLEDGKFSVVQLSKLRKKNWIPEEIKNK